MLRFFVSHSPAKKHICAVLLLASVTACLFWPLLFQDKILFFGDISLYFTPLLHFQRGETVGAGRIPLWNPTILCGTPFVGNPQAWPLYPSSLLLFGLSPEKVPGITGALPIFWAAVGTYAFLQMRGRSCSASLLGAVAWGFGGALVSKMQFPNMVQAASWLPWLLLACEGILQRATARRSVLLGLVVGLTLLAAHPQMFLLQCYLAASWTLWRLAGMKHGKRQIVGYLLLGFVLGIGLAAAQLLPTLELVRHSVRPDLPLEKANRFILPPYAVLTNFLAPNFYGNPASPDSPYVGRGNFWEPCCYAGILPFLLFFGGAICKFREGESRFWFFVGLIGIWLAVGRDAGLFKIAFYILPGINRFHDAARFLIPATFAVSCLAAVGFDHLRTTLKIRPRKTVTIMALGFTMLDVVTFSRTLNPVMDGTAWRDAVRSGPQNTLPAGRIFQENEGEIWGAFVSYRSYEALAEESGRRAFLQSLAPNLSVMSGWLIPDGYEPVRLTSIDRVMSPIKAAARRGELNLVKAQLDFLAVNHLAVWNRVPGKAGIVKPDEESSGTRAALWTNWNPVESAAEGAHRFNSPDWDGIPLVEVTSATALSNPPSNSGTLPVRVADISSDLVEIRLPKTHPAGLVTLADTLYPGWTVSVDGRLAEPLNINGAFRGVLIEEGTSVVQWKFDPASWRIGQFVSGLTVGIMALIVSSVTSRAWQRGSACGIVRNKN
ncbi:MAG: hypothetical protein V4671_05910 [Armatimonadota bacterium]